MKARRYNKSKHRHELIPPKFLEELAKTYTIGAEKYNIYDDNGSIIEDGSDNWKKGLSWKQVLSSVKRHINKFESGDDYDTDYPQELLDKYGGSLHLANAAWGLATLIDFYTRHPELDDRDHWYNKPFKRLFIDIDGVIAAFEEAFSAQYGLTYPPHDWKDVRFTSKLEELKGDKTFWVKNIQPIFKASLIKYPIAGYCTARSIPTEWIQEWLDMHDFPKAPIYKVEFGESKIEVLKNNNCEVFIDDSIHNFVELNSNGILCYLASRPHNEKYNVGAKRVKNIIDLISSKLC